MPIGLGATTLWVRAIFSILLPPGRRIRIRAMISARRAGGPFVKDKAFWFVNYEGQRFITTLTNTSVVPTAEFKTGQFTAPDPNTGAPVPVDVSTPNSPDNVLGLPLDPTMQKILALIPIQTGLR